MKYNTGNVADRLQTSKSINAIFYIFDFRQDLTSANDSHTHTHTPHTHTHTHMHTEQYDMPMAIGKCTDFPKK